MVELLLRYLWRYRLRLGAGTLTTILAAAFGLSTPYLLRQAIDSFSGQPSGFGWPLEGYAAAIVLLAVGEALARFAGRILVTGAARKVEYDVRNEFFAHLERMEPAFFQRSRTGDLVARATNDMSGVRQLISPALYHIQNTVLLFAVTLVLMVQISPLLASGALFILPFVLVVFLVTRRHIELRFTRVQEGFAGMADHSQEVFAGTRVVKAYAQEQAETETFRRTSADYVRRQMAQITLTAILWPGMTLFMGVLVVGLLYVGGREVVEGRLTLGQFVQFNAYLALLAWPIMAVGWVASMVQQGTSALRRVHAVLSTEPTIVDPPAPVRLESPRGEIEFRDVSLTLGGSEVLRHVNLHVRAGETVAIVGPLGGGKSLLAGLVTRMHDPTSGQVLVDGVDVRHLALADLRRLVGYVPQETFLFSGEVRENVAFGLAPEDATDERVLQAVRLSRLENDLDQWPRGLATIIGERGVTLSGGQKQRTSIARAVAKDPTILILDDALSSVDTRTEEAILEGLRGFMARRTSLVIAHRLSTVRLADRIVVLVRGEIAEEGTHQELVQRGGIYTQMYRRQLIAQELGVEDEGLSAQTAAQPAAPRLRARRPRVGGDWGGT